MRQTTFFSSRRVRNKSASRAALLLILLLAIVACVIGLVNTKNIKTIPTAQLGNQLFQLEVADTELAREQGLGGRQPLSRDSGMLFVFESSGTHCFWMKDMRFSIDMLWINAGKKVTHIEKSVSPSTYPYSFCPTEPSLYVLEVPAGTAAATDVQVGDQIRLSY